MAETYCGKSCAQCAQKEPMNCPGCKVGPGRQYGGDCELAQCVRSKGHVTCETCGLRGNCGNFRNCAYFPEYRRRKQEAEAVKQAAQARRVPVLAKWLWLLFWLVIPMSIAGLVSTDSMKEALPGLYVAGQLLNIACTAVYGLILLKLGKAEDYYRTAGIFTLIAGGISLLQTVVAIMRGTEIWSFLFLLPAVVIELLGECYECNAHSAVLEELDPPLSQKWKKLWGWFIGLYLGMFGCILLMLINQVLGALSLLGATIGLLVVAIMKLVYLYRTAKLFRESPVTSEPDEY